MVKKVVDGTEDYADVILNGNDNSPLSDIALLEVVGTEGVALPIASSSPEIGSEVIAMHLWRGSAKRTF